MLFSHKQVAILAGLAGSAAMVQDAPSMAGEAPLAPRRIAHANDHVQCGAIMEACRAHLPSSCLPILWLSETSETLLSKRADKNKKESKKVKTTDGTEEKPVYRKEQYPHVTTERGSKAGSKKSGSKETDKNTEANKNL